ncbi:hypothetical protein CRG98_031233 [Punica granatum]|uniref:Uncharacterized protein n=1 Tax=Punica granatum TaxID=22663 RepID=A0A2I0IXJ0_PUNGR|nr:hypothetical protein CRG98_031233 [Punica granatum]
MSLSKTWVDGTHGDGSTIGPFLGGGLELEEARLGPRSKAMNSAMSVAVLLIVPSSAAIGTPEEAGGGRWADGAP